MRRINDFDEMQEGGSVVMVWMKSWAVLCRTRARPYGPNLREKKWPQEAEIHSHPEQEELVVGYHCATDPGFSVCPTT